jgi:branched-chain amino acid transport system ATP-binding protein
MEIVQRYVSRILAFASGEVIKDGPVDEVLADAKVQELVTGKQHRTSEKAGDT